MFRKRFFYLYKSTTTNVLVFGQLPSKGLMVIATSGKKDVNALHVSGSIEKKLYAYFVDENLRNS